MKSHLSERLTLRRLAREAHVAVSTLSHAYRSQTGEPPMATLMRYRIDAAKGLLLKGYRLKAIAEQTAFSDAFHLSKAFKKLEGRSPRAFLRSL
jgi:AraC-like DNA-binding protein